MDTTAHSMAFAVYALAANPTIQKKAQQEVDQFNSQNETDQSGTGHIPAYVEAVLKESMRKYPTAATGSFRKVREEQGYALTPDVILPKESWILVNIFSIQNSVRIWGPDAKLFKPERFLSDDRSSAIVDPLDMNADHGKGNSFSSHAAFAGVGANANEISFMPFSFGMRNCIGMNLALMELRVGLIKMVSKFNFELADARMKDDDFMFETHFTSRPRNGLPMFVSHRK
jgi:cytochrome P450